MGGLLSITIFSIAFFAVGHFTVQMVGQKSDFGQNLVVMSDVQLWAEVIKCEDRKRIQLLLNQIPISVMARHAKNALQNPKNESGFGNLITQVLWTECSQVDETGYYCERVFESFKWKDASRRYEVEANVFDVRQSGVVLQKQDDSPVEVPIERLSTRSATRLKHYQTLRAKIASRIGATGH